MVGGLMVDQRPAPVEKLASVLGGRYETRIEPSHFRRATEKELSEWLRKVGSRQPRGMRRVNEAVLRVAANQADGLNAFFVDGFQHPSISEIAIAKLDLNVRITDHLIHPGWWATDNSPFGEDESDDEGICFYEWGAGSYIDTTDPDNPPTPDEIHNCFCVQQCVSCNSILAGRDDCEGPCN
jgi:hypothetical protein